MQNLLKFFTFLPHKYSRNAMSAVHCSASIKQAFLRQGFDDIIIEKNLILKLWLHPRSSPNKPFLPMS